MSGNYEIGYKKPPKATQFQKGKSGNPSGRRRGTKNLTTLIHDTLTRRVKVRENGKDRRVTLVEAFVTAACKHAVAGNASAMKALFKFIEPYRGFDQYGAPSPEVAGAPPPSSSFVWTEEDAKLTRFIQEAQLEGMPLEEMAREMLKESPGREEPSAP